MLLSLQGLLISFIALRLPGWIALIQGGSFLLTTFLLLAMHDGKSWELLLRQDFFIYVGLFALFRLMRLRRMREQEQRRFTEELTMMHEEQAITHDKLKQAHKELELATIQSLRNVVLEERSRIARDIHDSIGHRLTSVIVQMQAMPYAMRTDEENASLILKNVLDVTRGCLQEVRSIVHNMESNETGTGGVSLRSLVQHTASFSPLQIQLEMSEEAEKESWPLDITVVLYRCLQEAITNTIRHAYANRVCISVKQSEHEVVLHYRDDGILTPDSVWQEGFGLSGVRTRCKDMGGHCHIQAQEPQGIAIDIQLPLRANKEGDRFGQVKNPSGG
ncbi:hypothetical protein A3844_05365 [Paenibacillus helianthi]|uniref:histidine kinase n=1 Tax=Paenibacillus helianthi TaxID=1349432 RepID=A0ABX3ES15_9BACL|nr:hypothetical protein A3844_05365 [Paenibacillus helianthi]